jgi:fermentation-respiration switch protein FrsA (DUF1100 family)
LYNQQRLSPEQKDSVVRRMAPLAPVDYIGKIKAPVLLQFSKKDFYVPLDEAQALFNAAKEPKRIEYYDAGHELNPQASSHRKQYLRDQLKLHQPAH